MKKFLQLSQIIGIGLLLVVCLSFIGTNFAKGQSEPARPPREVTLIGEEDSSILSAVAVPANQAYFWASGTVPPPSNPDAPEGSSERYGDTRTQAIGALERIQGLLQENGLSLEDVIFLRVYLTADPQMDDQVDFQGFFNAYDQFFGTEDTPKVARSTVGVAELVVPEWLIEIEAVAVYPR